MKKNLSCIYCGEPFTEDDFGSDCKTCGYTLLPEEYEKGNPISNARQMYITSNIMKRGRNKSHGSREV